MNWNDLLQWTSFIIFSALVLGGALGMVLTMSMYRAGLSLMISLVALAGLFILLEADMLAVIQVMMNVGGMLVMILFMVMLMLDPGGEMMWDMKRRMKMPGFAALSMSMPAKPAVASSPKQPETNLPGDAQNMLMLVNEENAPDSANMNIVKKVELNMAEPFKDEMSGQPHKRIREIQRSMAVMQQQLGLMQQELVLLEEELEQPNRPSEIANPGPDHKLTTSAPAGPANSQAAKKTIYTCPMHPEIRSDKPGRCPKCGMDLVPIEAENNDAGGTGMVGGGDATNSNSSTGSQMTGHDQMAHSVTQGGSVETAAQMQGRSPQAYYRMMADMAMSTRQLPLAGIVSILVGLILVALIAQVAWPSRPVAPDLDGPARVGDLLLSGYMMAFEGAAFLILTGILGAVLLARREPANRRSRKKKPRAKVGNGGETATPNDNSRSEGESVVPALNSILLRSTEGR